MAANDDFYDTMRNKVEAVIQTRKPQINTLQQVNEATLKKILSSKYIQDIPELRADLNLMKMAANDETYENKTTNTKVDTILSDSTVHTKGTTPQEKTTDKPTSWKEKIKSKWN